MGLVYCGFTVRLPLLPIGKIQQTVALRHCDSDSDYEDGLRELWPTATDLVVVEHDIAATQDHINELLECPYILCTFAYQVHPASTGLQESRYVHANKIEGEYVWVWHGEEWADHAGLGLTKLGKLVRREVTDWPTDEADVKGGWWNLDTRVSRAMQSAGLKYHIHWPEVEHNHK